MKELECQRCGEGYLPWYTSNELWNSVVKDGEHFFCLDCFAFIAEEREAVGKNKVWELR